MISSTAARSCQRRPGRPDPSREAILQTSQQLQNEKQKLEMELAAQQARLGALQKQMLKTHTELAQKLKGNQMLAELEKMVSSLQESLNHQQQRLVELKDRGPSIVDPIRAKIDETQKKLAEVVTQVTQVRESAGRASGDELLGKLNGELATLAVSSAETQVRQKMLDEQLARLKESLNVADLYERDIALQLPSLKKAYERLQERAKPAPAEDQRLAARRRSRLSATQRPQRPRHNRPRPADAWASAGACRRCPHRRKSAARWRTNAKYQPRATAAVALAKAEARGFRRSRRTANKWTFPPAGHTTKWRPGLCTSCD